MATSTSGPKNSRSRKLKDTLGELETALSSWDQIIPSFDDEPPANEIAPHQRRRATSGGIPAEMRRRTRELLNQLKEQIDELSAEAPETQKHRVTPEAESEGESDFS